MMGCGNTKPNYDQQQHRMVGNHHITRQNGTIDRRRNPMNNNNSFDLETDESVEKTTKGSFQTKTVTTDTLDRFLDLEREVQFFEKRHVLETYQVKTEQLEQLEMAIEQLEEAQQELDEYIQNLHPSSEPRQSLKQYIMDKIQIEGKLNKQEEEIIDALNRKEIIQREMESTMTQRDRLRKEVVYLGLEGEKLQHIYQQRDELLDVVFGGEYGSEFENEMERELDLLQERKQHVDQAHFKWKQAQMMVKQAFSQLGLAVQKWKRIATIPEHDVEKKYHYAAETRNNLVAASQNLQGAHRYLPNVAFPYCTPEEMETLDKVAINAQSEKESDNLSTAITYIFTDLQSTDRYEHALGCYHTTYRRAGALRQWFEQVVNTTIARDLAELTDQVKNKSTELRLERIKLIKTKVKDVTGKDVDIRTDSRIDSELDDVFADEQVAQVFEADRLRGKAGFLLTPESRMGPVPLPTPLPMSDLAPMPSTEIIFGKIDELRREHQSQMQEFSKAQAMNQARMAQGLKEKLQARRNKRLTRDAHEREVQAMTPALH